jgi:acyl carrier protein
MSCDIETRLRKRIKENIEAGDAIDGLGVDDDLGVLGFNSVNFIKMVVAIEEEFSFEFDDAYLDFNKFKTLSSIIGYIEEMTSC